MVGEGSEKPNPKHKEKAIPYTSVNPDGGTYAVKSGRDGEEATLLLVTFPPDTFEIWGHVSPNMGNVLSIWGERVVIFLQDRAEVMPEGETLTEEQAIHLAKMATVGDDRIFTLRENGERTVTSVREALDKFSELVGTTRR